jgi:dienelactone hydrolase
MARCDEAIVFAPSADQRWMAGVLMRPHDDARRRVGVVCLHGSAHAFYFPPYIALGRAVAAQGYPFLSGNTRAHDVASMDAPWPPNARPDTVADLRLGGIGWRRFAEVAHDVAGWIAYLEGQGIERVVLFGHSFGAACATYYLTHRDDPRVVGLILASGRDVVTAQDPVRVQLAHQLVAQGKGATAMPLVEGVPPVFALESAERVVDTEQVFGPFASQGHTPWTADIRVPMLATFGTMEHIPNMRGLTEGMRARAAQAPRFDVAVIDGADHIYTDQEHELARVTLDWLAHLPTA